MRIRPEEPADITAVHGLNVAAFGRAAEADLVDALRREKAVLASLVAEDDRGQIVGHILFTRAFIETDAGAVPVAALGPMAVLPEQQHRGVGSELVRAGIAAMRAAGERATVVLGHARYYPRFGFRRADVCGWTCEFKVPPEVFMALPLSQDRPAAGVVRYHAAFATV